MYFIFPPLSQVASLAALRQLPAPLVAMLTATASGADGADFEKNGRVIIYAQFWRQLLLTMGQV
jgi:hypothetical protein